VWLYLSSAVCSFYFFKLTLVYCIVEIFLLLLLINSWGNRARIKRRSQTASSPSSERDESKNSSTNASRHSRGSKLSRGGGGESLIKHSSLPTLKPFQHPAFPPEAQVPLFVIQNTHTHQPPPVQPREPNEEELQAEEIQDVEEPTQ
jgi:hypothetical protein